MTPDEAIEVLAATEWVTDPYPDCPVSEAVQLGLEALKFFKDLRDRGALPADVRLPGETEK